MKIKIAENHLPEPVAILKPFHTISMGKNLSLVIIFLVCLALIWQKRFSVQRYTCWSHWYYRPFDQCKVEREKKVTPIAHCRERT